MNDSAGESWRVGTPRYDDEISLAELWSALARRKLLVLGTAAAVLLAFLALAYTKTPVYESRAVLSIGMVGTGSGTVVEEPRLLVERLRAEYQVDDAGPKQLPYVESVERHRDQDIVTVRVRDTSPAGAQTYLASVTGRVLARHDAVYEAVMAEERQGLAGLEETLTVYRQQLQLLGEQIGRLKTENPAQAAILVLERGKLLSEIPPLNAKRIQLKVALSDIASRPTRLLQSPTLASGPAAPNRPLYAVAGLLLGLFLGVFAAVFAEFAARARRRVSDPAKLSN